MPAGLMGMRNELETGQSRYRIVMPREADGKNRFAAQELARYILKITGAALPVVTDELPASEQEICVGPVSRDGLPDTSQLKNCMRRTPFWRTCWGAGSSRSRWSISRSGRRFG